MFNFIVWLASFALVFFTLSAIVDHFRKKK